MVKAVPLMLLAALMELFAVAETQSSDNCYLWGYTYETGDVIRAPGDAVCVRHICDHGRFLLYLEGCELQTGGCVNVGYIFTSNCITYECMRLLVDNNVAYVPYITRTRCRDAVAVCHENGTPGLNILDPSNEIVKNCTCLVLGQGNVTFDCP